MENFLNIAKNVDILPLMVELHRNPKLWNSNTLRTKQDESPHRDVSDILVWFNRVQDEYEVINDIQTYPYDAWNKLPSLRPIIFDLMRRVEATQLGRCVITKLPPGRCITPHADMGAPANFYDRFQICINSGPGCNFVIGDEMVCFKPGEVWLVDNEKEHSVVNNSKVDRIVIIVDLRCS